MSRSCVVGVVAFSLSCIPLSGCRDGLPNPHPDTVTIELSSSPVSADVAKATVVARASERGVPLEGVRVALTATLTDATGNSVAIPLPTASATDENGLMEAELTGLSTAASGTITATLIDAIDQPLLDPAGETITDTVDLEIVPGVPVSIDLALASNQVDPDADTSLETTTTLLDAQGNVTATPHQLSTDAPGASIVGDTLYGLSKQGTWTVFATADNGALVDSETVNVGAGAAATIHTSLSQGATNAYAGAPGDAVTVSYSVLDAFGNDVTASADVACTIGDPGATLDPGTGALSDLRAKGTFVVNCDLLDAAMIAIASDSELLTVYDTSAPTPITINSPAADTSYDIGDTIQVVVAADDVVGISRVRISVSGAFTASTEKLLDGTSTSVVQALSLTVPSGASGFGTLTLYAEAEDTSGNVEASTSRALITTPLRNLETGFSATPVADAPEIVSPRSIACYDTGAGVDLYIADRGSNTVWVIPAGATVPSTFYFDPTGNLDPEGVELDAGATNLYASMSGGEILEIPTANPAGATTIANINNARHLTFGADSQTVNAGEPLLYVADENNDLVEWVQTSAPANGNFTNAIVNRAWGVAYRATDQRLFVSSQNNDSIRAFQPDGNDGDTLSDASTMFLASQNIQSPRGLLVVDAGLMHAGDLLIANQTNQILRAEDPDMNGIADAVYPFVDMPNDPIDMALCAGQLFVLTDNGASTGIFSVSGF